MGVVAWVGVEGLCLSSQERASLESDRVYEQAGRNGVFPRLVAAETNLLRLFIHSLPFLSYLASQSKAKAHHGNHFGLKNRRQRRLPTAALPGLRQNTYSNSVRL